jgi:transposase
MTAAHATHSTVLATPVLYLAFEMGWTKWKLAFTVGPGQPPRLVDVDPRRPDLVLEAVHKAKIRFRLPDDTPVVSCYEAGREGFWVHRYLLNYGVQNFIVDSASIEVNRRKRRAKSDRLDAIKLVAMLIRWYGGDNTVWSVVNVPTPADEDARHLHRDMVELKGESTELSNRIKGLLAGVGLDVLVHEGLPQELDALTLRDGTKLPEGLKARVNRAIARWRLIRLQIAELDKERARKIRTATSRQAQKVRRLMTLCGIGENGAWLLVHEIFGWRNIRNRRELASLAGLTPTPYASGTIQHEQGISKAGNRLVRWMMVQLAWGWLRYQPHSDLSRWYERRFGGGNSRQRKVGIVALARKLLIALWKYLEQGEVPAGAEMRDEIVVRVPE